MSKKATSALAVIIVLGGCIIAAPYVIKTKMAKQFQHIQIPEKIQEQATQQGLNVRIKAVRYQENGLKADSIVRVFVNKQSSPSQTMCFDINSNVNYGYGTLFSGNLAKVHSTLENTSSDPKCGFTANPEIKNDQTLVEVVNQLFEKDSPFTSDTNLPWFGGYQTTLNIAARTITQPSGLTSSAETLQFKPLQIQIKGNGKSHTWTSFQWQGLNLAPSDGSSTSAHGINLSIGTITATADQQKSIDDFFSPGTFSFKAMPSTLEIKTQNPLNAQQFKMGQIEMNSKTSLSADKVISNLTTKISNVAINHVQLGNIIFNFDANQLTSELKKFATLRKQLLASSSSSQTKALQKFKQQGGLLLSSMHIKLNPFAIQQNNQQIGLTGKINIAKMDPAHSIQSADQTMELLKRSTHANLQLTIDTKTLKNIIHAAVATIPKFRQYIQPITDRYTQTVQRILLLQTRAGYLTFNKDKQEFKTQIKFNQGVFTLNGKVVKFY